MHGCAVDSEPSLFVALYLAIILFGILIFFFFRVHRQFSVFGRISSLVPLTLSGIVRSALLFLCVLGLVLPNKFSGSE